MPPADTPAPLTTHPPAPERETHQYQCPKCKLYICLRFQPGTAEVLLCPPPCGNRWQPRPHVAATCKDGLQVAADALADAVRAYRAACPELVARATRMGRRAAMFDRLAKYDAAKALAMIEKPANATPKGPAQ